MDERLRKFAKVLLVNGVNLQKNQLLYLNCAVEVYDFARMIQEEAYKLGAKRVEMNYYDDVSQKTMFHYEVKEVLSEFEDWKYQKLEHLYNENAAILSIVYPNFEDYTSQEIENMMTYQMSAFKKTEKFNQAQMNYEIQWSVTYYPNEEWAKKVFPNLCKEEALNKLWETVFELSRINELDPIKAWKQHDLRLKEKATKLDSYQFKELHYKNSLGTDFFIGLPKNHIWKCASKKTKRDIDFIPNIPTEEMFTTPNRYIADGVVYASLPLVYQGTLIEDIMIEFKNGKVINCFAKSGQEMLETIINADEGASYLGEVALVNNSSPISKSGLLFYSTLYDENASCHLALGNAYNCFSDCNEVEEEELVKRGKNKSNIHVDFMIGTNDLSIIGITQSGEEVVVFINGEWAI